MTCKIAIPTIRPRSTRRLIVPPLQRRGVRALRVTFQIVPTKRNDRQNPRWFRMGETNSCPPEAGAGSCARSSVRIGWPDR